MLNSERPPGEREDGPVFGTELGDLGVIAIAAAITITGLLMFVLPTPFAAGQAQRAQAEKAQALAAKQARQKEIDKAVATGEVAVGILPAKRP